MEVPMIRIAAALTLLAAASAADARPALRGPSAAPHNGRARVGAVMAVRVHRGVLPPQAGYGHGGRHGYGNDFGYGWPSYGYGYDGLAPRPSGFFADGDTWMHGRRVVYEYDRGYPYEHYRERRPPRESW
jgi:hypothetical protein